MIKTIVANNKEDFDRLVNEEETRIKHNPNLVRIPASTINIIPVGDATTGFQLFYTAVLYYNEIIRGA